MLENDIRLSSSKKFNEVLMKKLAVIFYVENCTLDLKLRTKLQKYIV